MSALRGVGIGLGVAQGPAGEGQEDVVERRTDDLDRIE